MVSLSISIETRQWTGRKGQATFALNGGDDPKWPVKPVETPTGVLITDDREKIRFRASGEKSFVIDKAVEFLSAYWVHLDKGEEYLEIAKTVFE